MPRKDKGKDEANVFTRPAPGEIRAAWITLFSDPMLSLANLKAVAAAGLGAPDDDGGILLRSVHWRFYFGLLPPPNNLDLFAPSLAAARQSYNDVRARFLVAPDGRWADDCSGGEDSPPSPASSSSGGVAWDPLSLDGDSPWKTWFAHLELRETIRQDVDRTFPDIPYFTLERVRRSLTTMLFIFAVLNPDVGYRQGMHELLAVCMMVVDHDSLDTSSSPSPSPISPLPFSPLYRGPTPAGIMEALSATLDRTYVEHDAFGLFQELMKPSKSFYEWRSEEGPGIRAVGAPQAPILERCSRIQTQLLRKIDPQLWEHFEQEGVEAQIWAIRWIRLILTRELPFPMALRLWDGIFAADPSLGILDFVCVAMLLLIRNELVDADYPSILTHLLHYPAPSDTYPFNPSLILQQANFLRHEVSPAAGVEVVIQNQELLGVKVSDRRKIDLDVESPVAWRPGGRSTPTSQANSARDRTRAGVSGLAAGLFERAQKAGLDKAFRSTVNDFRSNLPDASTAYSFFSPSRDTASPTPSNPFTSAALPQRPSSTKLPQSESNISIKSMLDAERQMAEVRLAMVTMGKAMSLWMDTIKEANGGAESSSDSAVQAEAWAGLDRVRDSLLHAAGKDVDDMVKDWVWNDDLDSSRSQASSTVPTPIYESVDPIFTKTPTRASFSDPPRSQDEPNSLRRVDPPPQISIPGSVAHAGPATATPDTTVALNSPTVPPAGPISAPPVHRSFQPLASSSAASSTKPVIKSQSQSHYQPPRRATATVATETVPGRTVSPPSAPAVPPSKANLLRPKADSSGLAGNTAASADPLAGLGVGSAIPRSSMHERKRSSWRNSTTAASLGAGSEPAGSDPLGARS